MTGSGSKLEKLKTLIASYESVVVAYSGGADSSLVAKVARDVLGNQRTLAVTALSAALPEKEKSEIAFFTQQYEIPHTWIETQEIQNPRYAANPVNRCYFCKTELYSHLIPLRNQRRFKEIANGANLDDLADWRPGLNAAREYEIKSPLVEAEFSKEDVRQVSFFLGLSTWDKPAAACLASRIPYGTRVTEARLRQIDQGEAELKNLGFKIVRLRYFGDKARIEFSKEETLAVFGDPLLYEKALSAVHAVGFEHIEIDPEGYCQGKLNKGLNLQPSVLF